MTQQQFESKVKELEVLSKKNPKGYKRKVLFMSRLGMYYLLGILGLSLIIVVGSYYTVYLLGSGYSLANRLAFVFIILIYFILKSMWVRFDLPQGIKLSREDSPHLFKLVESIQQSLKAPKVKDIILTDELNASVYQRPRLGLFGFYQNYLIIGAQLLMTTSEEELKGILAHEFGHLSGKDGKFSAKIYKITTTWRSLLTTLKERESKTMFLFNRFVRWYVPMLNAYTFVLERDQEYNADHYAVQYTNVNDFASGLAKLHVTNIYKDQVFWPHVFKQAKDESKPASDIFLTLQEAYQQDISSDLINEYLKEALRQETLSYDTHPALQDRLKAVQFNEDLKINYQESSLNVLFTTEQVNHYLSLFSQQWQHLATHYWQEMHGEYQQSKETLRLLEIKDTMTIDEQFEKAQAMEHLEGTDVATPLYQAILKEQPKHIPASFALGRILLSKQDQEGITLINDVMKQDIRYTSEGCKVLYKHYLSQGDKEVANTYYQRAIEFHDIYELAKQERETLRYSDHFLEHELSSDTITHFLTQMERYDFVIEAYLVRKDVKHLKEYPVYILGVKFHDELVTNRQGYIDQLANNIHFDGQFFVVSLYDKNVQIEEKIKRIENALLFSK